MLSATFTAERAFFVENNSYTGCLNSIGAAPEFVPGTSGTTATARGFYALGFSALPAVLILPGGGSGGTPESCTDVQGETYYLAARQGQDNQASRLSRAALNGTTLPTQVPAGGQSFTVAVAGYISQDTSKNTDTDCDRWVINQAQQVINQRSGL